MKRVIAKVEKREFTAKWLLNEYAVDTLRLKRWWWNPFKVKAIVNDMMATLTISKETYGSTAEYMDSVQDLLKEMLREKK